MTLYEVAKQVTIDKAYKKIRVKKIQDTESIQYDMSDTGNNRGWILLDLFTSSKIASVYEVLNPANQAKFNRMPLSRIVDFCLSH